MTVAGNPKESKCRSRMHVFIDILSMACNIAYIEEKTMNNIYTYIDSGSPYLQHEPLRLGMHTSYTHRNHHFQMSQNSLAGPILTATKG